MSASDIATVLFRTPDSIKLILDFEARPNHYLMQRQETNTAAKDATLPPAPRQHCTHPCGPAVPERGVVAKGTSSERIDRPAHFG